VDVRFADGQGALSAYWGYLSDGGLVLDDEGDLVEGDLVALNVCIESSRCEYRVSGRVVSRRPRRRQAVVAFEAGESGRFLHAALADNEVDVDARLGRVSSAGGDAEGDRDAPIAVRMVSVSREGCCVRLGAERGDEFAVGARVIVDTPRFRARGCVVWSLGAERGVVFSFEGDERARIAVADYVASL
jgi:Tfp pilus assembly protein PilZ